jgi:multiple sugar transport system substrate-binding protein
MITLKQERLDMAIEYPSMQNQGPTLPPKEVINPTPQPPQPSGAAPLIGMTPPLPKKKFSFLPFVILIVLVLIAVGFFVFKNMAAKKVTNQEVTLTWWGLWEDNTMTAALISEYEAKNPKVKIKYVKQSQQDYRERLTNALAKGTGPDIFRFHNTWVPMFKNELDYLPASVMSASEFAQTFYPVASADLTSKTGIVGIPLMYDGLALFINEDLFAKEGKSVPVTWDDLRETAKALTVKDEQGTITQAGVALGRTENVDHWQEILALMMLQNHVNLAKPTDQLASDALTFFTVFSAVDGVWNQALPTSTVAFAAGKLAMYFGPSWRALEIKAQNPTLKFKVVPVPQPAKINQSEADITYATYWAEGVWSRSPNKLEAWKFLKYLSEKASLEKLYQAAAKTRPFGEPYSRVDMAGLLSTDPILGSIISLAPNAQSWYLASRTWDGPTGINTQISKYFEDAVNSVNLGNPAGKALETVATGVAQVLSQYGLVAQ